MKKIIDYIKAHKEGKLFAASVLICALSLFIKIAGTAAATVLVIYTGISFFKKVLGTKE